MGGVVDPMFIMFIRIERCGNFNVSSRGELDISDRACQETIRFPGLGGFWNSPILSEVIPVAYQKGKEATIILADFAAT